MIKNIYVDMDGVLADFDDYVLEKSGKTIKEYIKTEQKANESDSDPIDGFITKYTKEDQMFEKFKPMPMVEYLRNFLDTHKDKIEAGIINVSILSAASTSNYSEVSKQKSNWLDRHGLSDIKRIFVKRSFDKSKYASAESILIDDRLEACNPFLSAGGNVLHYTDRSNAFESIKIL